MVPNAFKDQLNRCKATCSYMYNDQAVNESLYPCRGGLTTKAQGATAIAAGHFVARLGITKSGEFQSLNNGVMAQINYLSTETHFILKL